MLDLREYSSLGAALRAALERWPDEVCLIEADRERENCRLTYRQFKEAALPFARALQDSGFGAGARAAIIMTNQSKWLISAYAIFYCGGVLVPLDYKLTAREHLQLLAHSKAEILFVEYHLWRAITQAEDFANLRVKTVLVTEAPAGADLRRSKAMGRVFVINANLRFVERQRADWASIVYSSGTGGRPKGCVMTHENYLEQCAALASLFPFLAGRAVPEHSADESCDRFHGWIHRAVCLRRDGGAFADAAAGVHSRCVHALPHHLHDAGADGAEKPRARHAADDLRRCRRHADRAGRA